MKYALLGNPNAGKTTIFNALTGSKEKIANWHGVTIDQKHAYLEINRKKIEIVDLPGTYTLYYNEQSSLEEQITLKYIIEEKFEAIINVIDASNLERNLYLTMQLIEMNIPIILVVNMVDIARKKNVFIDYKKFENIMNCAVIPIIASKHIGINKLKNILGNTSRLTKFHVKYFKKNYPKNFNNLYSNLKEKTFYKKVIFLVNNPTYIFQSEKKYFHQLKNKYFPTNIDSLLIKIRYKIVKKIISLVCVIDNYKHDRFTEICDKFFMNKYLGLPIFLFIIYLMFDFSISIGGLLKPFFNNFSETIFIDGSYELSLNIGLPLWIAIIISQGLGLGINTVLTFIPQLWCMFLFLSFLEDSGYLTRAAYVMDRLMQFIGLPGKAFLPLVVGFSCNVPGIMATRILETKRDRLMTMIMTPFMSCGARLAIFLVLTSAFFPKNSTLMIFILYILGIVVSIITGYIMKYTLLGNNHIPLITELPIYNIPNIRLIIFNSLDRLKNFLLRSSKLIIPICFLMGALNNINLYDDYYDNHNQEVYFKDNSIIAYSARYIVPILKPMGITEENWPAAVGLITGILAKEVVIGTLNTLYSQKKMHNTNIDNKLKFLDKMYNSWCESIKDLKNNNIFNPFQINNIDLNMNSSSIGSMMIAFGSIYSVFAYMLFILLYIPCVSVMGAIMRESNKLWMMISIIWSMSIAYTMSVIFYQTSQCLIHPYYSLFLINIIIVYILLLIICMKLLSKRIINKMNIKNIQVSNKCSKNCTCTFKKLL